MLRPGGYAISFDVNGRCHEEETLTCKHCNKVWHIKHKCSLDELGGMCRLCMKMICAKCVDIGVCDPIEKKLERMEARDRALRSYGI